MDVTETGWEGVVYSRAGFFEHGDESSCFIKCGEFTD
jgi:hypothetical protein